MTLLERLRWDVRRIRHQARKVLLHRRIGHRWEEANGFGRRVYPDYDTYVDHQMTKFSALRSSSVLRHDRRFYDALYDRLGVKASDLRGRSVLCLAARQGTEVRAFIDRGAFAVGIDLNPGQRSRHVVVGDFHELQYADASVDIVYTNSLDHAFDLDRILAEVRRVLRPDGTFIVEANVADEEAASAGPYEATVWSQVETLIERIAAHGFELTGRVPFEVPWRGEQLTLRVTAQDAAG